MEANTRRKLAMASRALSFSRANPADDPGYTSVVERLEQRLARAEELRIREGDGHGERRTANAKRQQLRGAMMAQLQHLAKVAEHASREEPGLVGDLRAPAYNAANLAFLSTVKARLAKATEFQEVLVRLSLGTDFVAALGAAVAEFEALTEVADKGRREHVGARRDLQGVARECVELVGLLDGFNKARFKDDRDALAAWESARNVLGPFKRKGAASDGTQDPTVPPAGAGEAAA